MPRDQSKNSKTFLYRGGFVEYTSWYMDGDFLAQYRVETSSLRPQAQNPQDDFNSMASQTKVVLLNFTINVFGAVAKL